MKMAKKHMLLVNVTALSMIAAAGHAQKRGTASTYIGPDGGAWSLIGNWDNGVPNGNYDALINSGGGTVDVFVDTYTQLHNLTIDADDSVTINNGRELRMRCFDGTSNITNAGRLTIASVVSNTYLRFDPLVDGDTFLLSGGGEIVGSGGSCYMYETGGQAVLHNVDNTIRGSGLRLGYNTLEVINEALIWSDSGGYVYIDPPEGLPHGFVNIGTMRADGGTLRLSSGRYDNDGGVIEALNGSIVELTSGASIYGGTLRGVGGGEIRASSGTASIVLSSSYTPTLEGMIGVSNGQALRIYGAGTLNNTGTVLLDSIVSNTYLTFDPITDGDTCVLNGGGEIVASGGSCYMYETGGQAVLHNVDNTIRGSGLRLGYNTLEVINESLIWSDSGGYVYVDPPEGLPHGFVNTGTARADGGTLRLSSGRYDNDGGVIEALNGSIVELTSGASIYGGTLRGVGGGEIRASSGTASIVLSSSYTPTLEGALRIDNGQSLRIYGAGTLNNTGTILLDSVGSNTYLKFDPITDGDTCMLIGGGEIVGVGGSCYVYEDGGQAVLHNVDNTIRGSGLRLGYNILEVLNEGTILADSDDAEIRIDPPTTGIGFDNQGLIHVTGAAGLSIAAGPFTTSGTVTIAADTILTRTGDWNQTDGTTRVDGTLTVNSGVLELLGGTLTGEGTVEGDVSNSSTVSPGNDAGTLSVIGDYTQNADGTLAIELGGVDPGTDYDMLAITGDADLAGDLTVETIDGFAPMVGEEFTILTTTGTVNGFFRFFGCGEIYQLEYLTDAVILHVVGFAIPGDLNCDGCVDQADLGLLLASYGVDDGGDIDGDGDTDQADLGALLSNYGSGC